MTAFREFEQDSQLRRRLIFVCLAVATMVSAVYATVSYRLVKDMSIRTETHYLEQEGLAFLHELEYADAHAIGHLKDHVPLTFGPKNSRYFVYINHPKSGNIIVADKVSQSDADTLIDSIDLPEEDYEYVSGHMMYGNQSFIWFQGHDEAISVTLLVKPNSLDASMSYAFKRLAITSAIVFWIAVWLALLLSSWITKRVQDKTMH